MKAPVIRTGYCWDSNWKVTLTMILALPLLLRLGLWQLDRAEEKRLLQNDYIERASQPILAVSDIIAMQDDQLAYRLVKLKGVFDNQHNVLLDNRIFHGQVGYEVLSPFIALSGHTLLVNRGWIAGHADRRLPAIPTADKQVEIVGSVYVSTGESVLLDEDQWAEGWPIVVQAIDIDKSSARLGATLYRHTVRLQPGYPAAFSIDWPAVSTGPEKHTGYAVQWFFMAFALALYWFYSSLTRK